MLKGDPVTPQILCGKYWIISFGEILVIFFYRNDFDQREGETRPRDVNKNFIQPPPPSIDDNPAPTGERLGGVCDGGTAKDVVPLHGLDLEGLLGTNQHSAGTRQVMGGNRNNNCVTFCIGMCNMYLRCRCGWEGGKTLAAKILGTFELTRRRVSV